MQFYQVDRDKKIFQRCNLFGVFYSFIICIDLSELHRWEYGMEKKIVLLSREVQNLNCPVQLQSRLRGSHHLWNKISAQFSEYNSVTHLASLHLPVTLIFGDGAHFHPRGQHGALDDRNVREFHQASSS